MGYTHYFTHTETTQEKWDKIVKDCRKLFKSPKLFKSLPTAEPLQIGTWNHSKLLRTLGNKKEIAFNGFPFSLAHESFLLYRKGSNGFHFCKTARKPYDLLVCACLIVYMFHSEDTMELSSDGDWEDWTPAMEFVAEVLGANYVMKFKMCEKVEI